MKAKEEDTNMESLCENKRVMTQLLELIIPLTKPAGPLLEYGDPRSIPPVAKPSQPLLSRVVALQ